MNTFIKYNSSHYKNTPIGMRFKKQSTLSHMNGSESTGLSNTALNKKEPTISHARFGTLKLSGKGL